MSQLPKTMQPIDTSKIADKATRQVLDQLIEKLADNHRRTHNDLHNLEQAHFRSGDVEWRIIIVDDNFEFQKKVDGVWTKKGAVTA